MIVEEDTAAAAPGEYAPATLGLASLGLQDGRPMGERLVQEVLASQQPSNTEALIAPASRRVDAADVDGALNAAQRASEVDLRLALHELR